MGEEVTKIGMKPPHPGGFIREEILEELNLPVARAAEILGVRRATLSDLINGHAARSPEMALRIEKAFGVSMDMLLRMQACTTPVSCANVPQGLTYSAMSLPERSWTLPYSNNLCQRLLDSSEFSSLKTLLKDPLIS